MLSSTKDIFYFSELDLNNNYFIFTLTLDVDKTMKYKHYKKYDLITT